MTRKETRIFIIICLLLAVLAGVLITRYYFQMKQWKIENSPDPSEVAQAMTGEELTAGYRAVTTESLVSQTQNGSQTVLSRTFTHKIYGPDGAYLATLQSNVIANLTDAEPSVTSVSAKLSDEQRDGLTLSEHVSGDTGTVVLYLNQISACHFQYRVDAEGTIAFV
ncbi:MAG: hypothetical protein IJB59_02610 [Oscillospiraceae bacterium]|nr:hypothetical protein [Oscillospiraceae bacterium]